MINDVFTLYIVSLHCQLSNMLVYIVNSVNKLIIDNMLVYIVNYWILSDYIVNFIFFKLTLLTLYFVRTLSTLYFVSSNCQHCIFSWHCYSIFLLTSTHITFCIHLYMLFMSSHEVVLYCWLLYLLKCFKINLLYIWTIKFVSFYFWISVLFF